MPTSDAPGVARAERYWDELQKDPWREHTYASLLGLRTFDPVSLHERVEEGLSFHALERLRRVLALPMARFAELVRVSPRTIARRKETGRLEADESDRLLRLSRIVALGLGLFEGDLEGARNWLTTPHSALGRETPLDFATTEVGAREVEHLIGRIEHGIPL